MLTKQMGGSIDFSPGIDTMIGRMDAIARWHDGLRIHPLISGPKVVAMLTICLVLGENYRPNSNALRHTLK